MYNLSGLSDSLYKVTITDQNNCTDTTFKHIWISDEYWMYVPNSFTPDNDKTNDVFCISYNGIREYTFVFNVYNRFSDLVYSTNDINSLDCQNYGWDGRHIKTGEVERIFRCAEGKYESFIGFAEQPNSFIMSSESSSTVSLSLRETLLCFFSVSK